jgi:hypothetical protein
MNLPYTIAILTTRIHFCVYGQENSKYKHSVSLATVRLGIRVISLLQIRMFPLLVAT